MLADTCYVSLGVLGILVGFSTELAVVNKLNAVKPAIWVVSFGLLVCAMVMVCLSISRFILPGCRNKHDWGHAGMEAGANEWSARERTGSEHPLSHHELPSKEGGTS